MTATYRPSAQRLGHAKRVVVKIGSALLVDDETGRLKRAWLDALADDVAKMRSRGQEVLIVSSGAIALGSRALGLKGALKLEEKQAAAACGQIRLAHAYQEALARHDLSVAQILLTLDDTEKRRQYLNARSTMNMLLKVGAVPVINENDTVATAEIRFGDNDRLAARVTQMVSADCLILLSDIDGLYSADPRRDETARFIAEVTEITPEIEAMATGSRSGVGRGGMPTKLMAARISLEAGAFVAIADGRPPNALEALAQGQRCTWFVPKANPKAARKQWIEAALMPRGALVIDAGAAQALAQGKSLLPAGVTHIEGSFERGDAVIVRDAQGAEIGRGLIAYGDADARRIMGHKSREIEALLGYRGRDEMIHRDDLVLGSGKKGR
jgi:glutamate 5-kinase